MKDSLNVQFNDNLLDWSPNVDTGYNAEIAKEDSVENFAAAGFVDFPNHLWIEKRDWEDYAAQNDKYQTWARDYSNRFTNQGGGPGVTGTTECVTHCLLQCCESTYNKQRGGITKDAVWFSALGIYEEGDPSGRSGMSVVGGLKIAMRRGMVPEYDGPDGPGTQKAKYKFTRPGTRGIGNATQSRTDSWLKFSNYPNNFTDTSRHFKPLEIINVDSWEQHFCLLLHGYAIGNGRNGHAIPHMRAVQRGGVWYSEYKDSYDRFLYDSISTVSRGVNAAYCIASFTQPDDWSKPAGSDMIV